MDTNLDIFSDPDSLSPGDALRKLPTKDIRRIKFEISYDGTDFHGWAAQPGMRTVAGEIQEALGIIAQQPIMLTVAGRTDAGVHATGQVAHADIPDEVFTKRGLSAPKDLVRRLHKLLPEDIKVLSAQDAPKGFDARFSALRRHYIYRVSTDTRGVAPLKRRDTAWWPREVNIELMQEAAQSLVGLHDFTAFCKYKDNASTIRDLQLFEWTDISDAGSPRTYEAHIIADAFCWSMVRSLIGTCLGVGSEIRTAGFPSELLAEDQRSSKIHVAPAHGLTLTQVDYPHDSELGSRAEVTRSRRDVSDLSSHDPR